MLLDQSSLVRYLSFTDRKPASVIHRAVSIVMQLSLISRGSETANGNLSYSSAVQLVVFAVTNSLYSDTALTCSTSLVEHTRLARAFVQAISDMCCQNKLAVAIEPRSTGQRQSFYCTFSKMWSGVAYSATATQPKDQTQISADDGRSPFVLFVCAHAELSASQSSSSSFGSQPWSHSMAVPVVADWGMTVALLWMARYQLHVQQLA